MQLAVCLLLGLAASAEDLWRRRISNRTVVAGLAAGLASQIVWRGWVRGPAAWMAGVAVGFGVFLIFLLVGGMGGGDIKLMAAFGGCLGAGRILWAALFTAMAGALMACGYLLGHWLWRQARPVKAQGPAESIPYAPAILIGVLLSLL